MIKLGSNNIGKIFLGSNPIGKSYLGSNLIFDKGATPPGSYTLVDYIETDGVAYIDTGIPGITPKSAELNVVPVIPESANNYIMGCRKDSGNTRFVFLLVNANGHAGYAYAGNIYNGTDTGINCSTSATNKTLMLVRCSLTNNSQYFGIKEAGESSYTTKHTTLAGTITSNSYNFFVFGSNNYGTATPAKEGTRIQHVKIWSEADYSGLLFNGEACYYNGEYGLWDHVSNSFFGNAANSGAFSGPSNS